MATAAEVMAGQRMTKARAEALTEPGALPRRHGDGPLPAHRPWGQQTVDSARPHQRRARGTRDLAPFPASASPRPEIWPSATAP